ncbi:methylaspartate mutase subunit E [Clostridium cochlearium]|uniref:methylaspartate mutase subunit E n=1 Tax=Clostridium cochlearium TaxID=1494 RepID=UPI000B94699D|nr:methylaspartate mutase subunit E [Clostridium cochlearium]6H9E_B Chain B, Glutamate mutase epsilon subunit [Clostridium cochlearium]6H9E_D Chain D, Glutamate mutase epsilon subunit [Clostridium cochlearium]6H9F_B Chain B, Glutamate mutase epsilon subunit [Clostridium cochlearium]6H9F_D Chain D, Glutamate mutase epsilon subunit [Clostridium cochlearium]MBU5269864.1 methylaspartate mutase subunit E [Clostridium cochlearium]SNV88897.1 glutamate mutase, mutE [Clostridium cochlearium]STA93735.
MELKNKKWTDEEFHKQREEVLQQWPTGKEVDLQEAVDYLKKIPAEKNFAEKLVLAKKKGITMAQPRAGVALLDEHIELLRYLQDEGGADFLPSTIDAYTRQNRYDECENGIKESEKAGRSLLNGFPGVNHGVKGCRKVLEAVNLPLQARHGTPDSRLLAEIIHAGGWTSNEGGGISYNVPYAKNVTIEKSLLDWQYCDRLVGFYEEQGVHINREPFGPLTGTLVPPSMSNAVGITEALLAAEQGVKNITVGYGECGNMIQDIAALRCLEEQTNEYLKAYGYNDVFVTTVFHQWMGGFPQDESKAFGVIVTATTIAALAGATKVIVKTPHEAIGIPTKEANAAGIKATKMALNMLEGQRMPMSKELETEMAVIKAETKCILDKMFELGKGDLAIGTVKAFETGVMDIPFGPSKYNAGKMMPVRDNLGCVRYLEFGNVPFTEEIKNYNRERLQERAKFEGRDVSFQMVIDDIFAVGKGRLIGRPE